ncbi:uncharacterized protein TNCV_4201 [Trichonephila clavipes]|nr:uncharacterized protein TNCV_4201 [Trichonephila clavipes]
MLAIGLLVLPGQEGTDTRVQRTRNEYHGMISLDSDYLTQTGKGLLTPAGLLKLVKRFEETGKLEDRARAGRPCLKEARAPCIIVEMEAIAPKAASGTSSAREAARRLGLPPSSVRNILRRILQLYPYKLQSCHELLPADSAQREAFAIWAFSKMEQDPTWVSNI